MRIFLTGAIGYIGSAVLDGFIHAGHQVTALVRTSENAEIVSMFLLTKPGPSWDLTPTRLRSISACAVQERARLDGARRSIRSEGTFQDCSRNFEGRKDA